MIRILVGNEPYLIAQEKRRFISSLSQPELNVNLFTSFDVDTYESASMLPMFDEYRVAVVEIESLSKLDNKAFNAYMSDPSELTELIVVPKEYDARTKFYKTLKEAGYIFSFDKYESEKELVSFIGEILKAHKASMKMEALAEFMRRENYLDNDKVNLYNIVNDLQTLLSVSSAITLDEVKNYVKENDAENVFALAKLLSSGDAVGLRKECMKLSKDSAIPTISLLLREYRIALKSKLFDLKNIGVKYAQLKDMDRDSLLKGTQICTEAIQKIKNGELDANVALSLTIGRLLNIK